ncbi:hypothetical protein AXF42_Ash018746 [Apostasia shenzhenica]|uniref:Uncharacterized protein n=1 Tax=Apostasia shenzhenica TaxID=1088818 RepID=A0A2I0AJV1_9ASPA|nr:hypothetical protein AXF42_Ash018746 [Apostasia shenzhenica]
MAYSYSPAYYSSFQETINSLCKSILLPFSFKNRRLPADQKLADRHADNLKWQQDSFHRILELIGLHKEGIVPEAQVSIFRANLLENLITAPSHAEPPSLIRDKLLFLQELLYAKCISVEEYHSSKRPLLSRLASQGVEIDCKDVIVGTPPLLKNTGDDEWTDIDLSDQKPSNNSVKAKEKAPTKHFWRGKGKKDKETNNSITVLMPESSPINSRKFSRVGLAQEGEERAEKKTSKKKAWGFDGFKKWKRSCEEDESTKPYLPPGERSDEGPNAKRIKKRMHFDHGSASDFFTNNKATEERIKQSEKSAANQSLRSSVEKQQENGFVDGTENWVAFEDDNENFHPNLFSQAQFMSHQQYKKDEAAACSAHNSLNYNPFSDAQNPFLSTKRVNML